MYAGEQQNASLLPQYTIPLCSWRAQTWKAAWYPLTLTLREGVTISA